MMARSALPSPSRVALAAAPSVCTGRNRTWLLFWLLKACVSACTTLRSSLLAGPTAIRSVTVASQRPASGQRADESEHRRPA